VAAVDPLSSRKLSFCHSCGAVAPTRRVVFVQLISFLLLVRIETETGNLCKSCIHGCFWDYTVTTLGLGWWGILCWLTPFVLVHNVIRYTSCLLMPAGPKLRRTHLPNAVCATSPSLATLENPW
jgi:hypothetical protein